MKITISAETKRRILILLHDVLSIVFVLFEFGFFIVLESALDGQSKSEGIVFTGMGLALSFVFLSFTAHEVFELDIREIKDALLKDDTRLSSLRKDIGDALAKLEHLNSEMEELTKKIQNLEEKYEKG